MLHKIVDACHLRRDVDLLGAVFHTFLASDAVIGLAELRNAPVVAYEECATGFAVVLRLGVFRNVALIDTFVVVQKHTGYIQTVGAGHTVFAVVAGHGGELHHYVGCIVEELHLFFGEGLQRTE